MYTVRVQSHHHLHFKFSLNSSRTQLGHLVHQLHLLGLRDPHQVSDMSHHHLKVAPASLCPPEAGLVVNQYLLRVYGMGSEIAVTVMSVTGAGSIFNGVNLLAVATEKKLAN